MKKSHYVYATGVGPERFMHSHVNYTNLSHLALYKDILTNNWHLLFSHKKKKKICYMRFQ